MTPDEEAKTFAEGKAAFVAGKPIRDCPHSYTMRELWRSGWFEAWAEKKVKAK